MAVETVCSATCRCCFGTKEANLMVFPIANVYASKQPAGTIMDFIPFVNVLPFEKCQSLANPIVLIVFLLTGSLDKVPCTPMTFSPWEPGSPNVFIGGCQALSNTSILMCTYEGVIVIENPNQMTVLVP